MILITNVKVFRNTGAKATPHCNLILCKRDLAQNVLVTIFEHTTFINRNLVTGVQDCKVITLLGVCREHDLIHRVWEQQLVGAHGRWNHTLSEDCHQYPVCV